MNVKRVFLWELGDMLRLVIFLLVVFSLTYLLAVNYLKLQWGVGSFDSPIPPVYSYNNEDILGSMTTEHLFTYLSTTLGFWVLLALGISIFSVIGIRYDRERGYALSVYSLPYSKADIFLGKVFSVFILSFLAMYIPVFVVNVFLNVDILRFIVRIIFTRFYLNALIFALYFLLFSMAISLFFSVVLRDMLLAFIASFFLLVLPFFGGLDWPPFSFVPMIHRALAGVSPLEFPYIIRGFLVPTLLFILSGLIFTRGDVM
ncbi:hypothetical protein [Thermococcus sp.]